MNKRTRISIVTSMFLASSQMLTVAKPPLIPKDVRAFTNTAPTEILGITGTTYGQGSTIYDVDAMNGNTTNPRTPTYQSSNYKIPFVGFTLVGNSICGLTFSNLPSYASTLFGIGPNYSFNSLGLRPPTTLNGTEWRCGLEGDIAYDKTSGKLYATCSNGGWKLVRVDLVSSAVTIPGGNIGSGGYYSALAFNAAGELYALDTVSRVLVKLNKNTGGVQGSPIPLSGQLPNTSVNGGMGFNDAGVLYAAFGGKLMTINVTTGAVSIIGNTANFSGLIVQGGGLLKIEKKKF